MNLLIVDDEYYSAESTRRKIAENGPVFTEIFCAYNMKQALEIFSTNSIAIMILDIEMPGGSGWNFWTISVRTGWIQSASF